VNLAAALASTQLVVYVGKKGLGAQEGSGHPLLLGVLKKSIQWPRKFTIESHWTEHV
jgi:hypothetical protein